MVTNSSKRIEVDATEGLLSDRSSEFRLVQTLLDASLQAQRNGRLEELVRNHPRAARWLMRKYWGVVRGSAGDALLAEPLPLAATLLLSWLVTQLRPDTEPSFEGIGDDAWLRITGWRPMLAMASHQSLIPVPDFPHQYRRTASEAPLDNLCGLWNVDTSTLYRTLDKARQMMVQILTDASSSARTRNSLRTWVVHALKNRSNLDSESGNEEQLRWHVKASQRAISLGDPMSALWHLWRNKDVAGFVRVLVKHAPTLAAEVETDALVDRAMALELAPDLRVNLWLARAALERARSSSERELHACEQAKQVAQLATDSLLLGIVYSALGRFYEPRDADRAFAYYQQSAEFLRGVDPIADDSQLVEHFVITYARLAWLYLLRNDERCEAVLQNAEALRARFRLADETLGMLEQVWGQYWRRAGNHARSLEHRFRALNIFERIGDQRAVLNTRVNISFDLASLGKHERAAEYSQRVLEVASLGGVEPEIVFGARLTLGASHFWKGELDSAIHEYRLALEVSLTSELPLAAFRVRYNLAEAHYARFRELAHPEDEKTGDFYVNEVLTADATECSPGVVEAARTLKCKVLDRPALTEPESERLLPGDFAVYPELFAEIHRHRQLLAIPAQPEPHALAHLAIARAYVTIAAKEREAALALIQRAGLQHRFSADLAELQQTFERGLTHEQKLQSTWKKQAADILDDSRRAALVTYLLSNGAVNKSRYAELGAVSPATASKHLAMLTERGLLVQHGKGPSTRYQLPE
jgi:tetratricopeptide (TPR) repeat protein